MNRKLWVAAAAVCLASTSASYPQSAPLLNAITGRLRLPTPQVSPVQGLRDRMQQGALHLRLADYLQLVLLNNTQVRITQLNDYSARYSVVQAHSPFDPTLGLNFSTNRSIQPEYTQINGASTLSSLNQISGIAFNQTLATGQQVSASFSGNRSSNNSAFDTYNPSLGVGVNFNVTQPLWRNRGNLQNKIGLLVAQAQVLVVTDQTQASVADLLVSAADQYWNTVEARDQVQVAQQALDLAQQSYDRDKRSLELGALAPGDIFTSQSQVATDQTALLQSQSQYRQQLDLLRRQMGADLDPTTRNVDIALEDDPAAVTPLPPAMPVDDAVAAALRSRPELDVAHRQLQEDALTLAQARDALHPQLNLTGTYGSNALGGTAVQSASDLGVTTGTVSSIGLGSALNQLLGFGSPTYGFSLSFSLPVRSSSATANLANALLAQTNQEYQERNEQQQVIQDVRVADTQLRMAVATVQSATTARDLSQKNVDAEQQKYQLGTITAFELSQAQVQLATAQNTLLNSYTQYQISLIAYERATWTLLDKLGLVISAPLGPAVPSPTNRGR